MPLRFNCALLTLAGLALSLSASAQTYDATASFLAGWNANSNPNGVWRYGYSTAVNSTLNLYPSRATAGFNGGHELFWYAPSIDQGGDPTVALNNGPAIDNGNINFLANELVLTGNPGTNGYSHVVFTAPATGNYSITAGFRNDQYNSITNGYVSADGALLFQSVPLTTVGQTANYSGSVSLSAGQTIDFAINSPFYNNIGLTATITSTPEPGTWALLGGLSASGAAFFLRRRQKCRRAGRS